MVIPVNYVNCIIVLPKFQILVAKYNLMQEPMFVDDYETTVQCTVNEDENELQCLTKEINYVLGINLSCLQSSDKVQLLRFGTFPGSYVKSNITLYLLNVINTITFKIRKNYEMRILSPKKALNEVLDSLTSGYYNTSDARPEYTSVAECVLQRVHSYGGLMKCMRDSS